MIGPGSARGAAALNSESTPRDMKLATPAARGRGASTVAGADHAAAQARVPARVQVDDAGSALEQRAGHGPAHVEVLAELHREQKRSGQKRRGVGATRCELVGKRDLEA